MKALPGEVIYNAFCHARFRDSALANIPLSDCDEATRKAWAAAEGAFCAASRDESRLVCAALAGMDIDRELAPSVYAVRAFAISDAVRAERERRIKEKEEQ